MLSQQPLKDQSDTVAPVSYHPALPSIAAAATPDGYAKVTSDHVPILARVPWPENSKVMPEVKILSWNVLESDGGNGFAPPLREAYGESGEQRDARHKLIAQSLRLMVEQNEPHFIALQEIYGPENDSSLLFGLIRDCLGSEWEVARDKEGKAVYDGGNITFYNNKYFRDANQSKREFRGNRTSFTSSKVGGQKIDIVNTHANYCKIPVGHEQQLEKSLIKTNTNKTVVIGDFNCTIANIHDDQPQNITTSVSPAAFNEETRIQGAYSIDGCFYSHQVTPRVFNMGQARIVQLNPDTGLPYNVATELAPIKSEHPDQLSIINAFRMAIAVDPVLIGQTSKYQAYLEEQLEPFIDTRDKKAILVRVATTINNKKGIGVQLPFDIYNELKSAVTDKSFQFEQIEGLGGRAAYVVFVPDDKKVLLATKIDEVILAALQRSVIAKNAAIDEEASRRQADIAENNKSAFKKTMIGLGIALLAVVLAAVVVGAIAASGGIAAAPILGFGLFISVHLMLPLAGATASWVGLGLFAGVAAAVASTIGAGVGRVAAFLMRKPYSEKKSLIKPEEGSPLQKLPVPNSLPDNGVRFFCTQEGTQQDKRGRIKERDSQLMAKLGVRGRSQSLPPRINQDSAVQQNDLPADQKERDSQLMAKLGVRGRSQSLPPRINQDSAVQQNDLPADQVDESAVSRPRSGSR